MFLYISEWILEFTKILLWVSKLHSDPITRIIREKYKSSIFGLSGNANYHFNTILEIPSNWDFYAGLNIGYFFWATSDDYPGTESSGLGLGAQIGGRYFFSRNFGLNLEFGGGNAFSGENSELHISSKQWFRIKGFSPHLQGSAECLLHHQKAFLSCSLKKSIFSIAA